LLHGLQIRNYYIPTALVTRLLSDFACNPNKNSELRMAVCVKKLPVVSLQITSRAVSDMHGIWLEQYKAE
jgi:hypothetical protein